MADSPPVTRRRWSVLAIRYGLPLILIIGGIVMIILGHGHVSNTSDNPSGASIFTQTPTDTNSMLSAIGVGAIVIALMVALVGFLMRLNVSDGADRRREEAARDYFSRTGRWPGEQGPRGSDT